MPLTLVAPLNWGLGHAARCIPIIRQELDRGNEVLIAADGLALNLLVTEFPGVEAVVLPDLSITYSHSLSFFANLAWQLPGIMKNVAAENQLLDYLVAQHKPDIIISDNRYGLWHRKKKSVLLTHQLYPIAPRLIQKVLHWQLKRFMSRFDEIWIPDYPGETNLSGKLSHRLTMPSHARFIGPLSRFSPCPIPAIGDNSERYELVGLVSGPEPHRSLLFRELSELFAASGKKSLVLGGMPGAEGTEIIGNLSLMPHLDSSSLQQVLCRAERLFVRSGYSTIMDLHALGIGATVIPTPGQTEQEYLAGLHSASGWLQMAKQGHLSV